MMTAVSPSDFYGLGYSFRELPDGKISKGHGGSNRGWQANFLIIPETGDGIVVTTNGSNGWAVHGQITCAWMEWLTGTEPEQGCERPIGITLIPTILEQGVPAAIKQYRELKNTRRDDYIFSENQLNTLGYQLLGKNRIREAIEIFKLNVEAFPEAFNPYDSLGEAYMLNGNTELAIENYKKSLQLNPNNTNAVDMLKKLQL